MITSATPIDRARFERACEWFLDLREQSQSPDVIAEWLLWCRADPLNREAFERARTVWQSTGELRAEDLGLAKLASASEAAASLRGRSDAGAEEARDRAIRGWRWVSRTTIAAGIVAVAVLLASSTLHFTAAPSTTSTLTTKRGENRIAPLSDGSTVILGGDSRLLTAFHQHTRSLVLEQGEAYFRVARDRSRPFVVAAGDLQVTAVGTAFNVRTGPDRVVVAVAEGVVAIEPPAVAPPSAVRRSDTRKRGTVLSDTLRAVAGQQVAVDSADDQLQVIRVEPTAIASWQHGRLQFAREPLRAVIASVNRYSARQVVLDDPSLGDLRFTGTVFVDRVEDWLRGLPAVFPVSLRDDGTSLAIVPQTTSAAAQAPAS